MSAEPEPLSFLGHHEVDIVGVVGDEGAHEPAEGLHPQATPARVVERLADQRAGKGLALVLWVDLRVQERDHVVVQVVVRETRHLAVDDDLVSGLGGVVANGGRHPPIVA